MKINNTIFLLIGSIIFFILMSSGCKESLTGLANPIEPPTTEILNVPAQNGQTNPYYPIMEINWKGVSNKSLIKGFWVSIKSYFINKKDSIILPPYFTTEMVQMIAFPSADVINRQVLNISAEDINGNIDPVGAQAVYYTSSTTEPETYIHYPMNNFSAFILDKSSVIWKGVPVFAGAITTFGVVKDYSLQVDNGAWSAWQTDSIFYLNSSFINISALAGKHTIQVKARNNAYVEDPTPASVIINFIIPQHEKDWLIIDDTKDYSGAIEQPTDTSVDDFYARMMAGTKFDVWDIAKQGMISKPVLGSYKYVIWHSDHYLQSSLPDAIGILTDYLKTRGRLLVSQWNSLDYFTPGGAWLDSVKYYGNFLSDLLHITTYSTIQDAQLLKVASFKKDSCDIDLTKLYSFRKGIFKVNYFSVLKAFTDPMFFYSSASNPAFDNRVIGYGYHNSDYQFVVLGFPLYFLKESAAKTVFDRSKEFLETQFPF